MRERQARQRQRAAREDLELELGVTFATIEQRLERAHERYQARGWAWDGGGGLDAGALA